MRGAVVSGMRDSVALALALIPIGLAFGYAADSVGLSWWLAGLMSAVVYGGPSQFLVTGLIATGAAIPSMVATTFVANLRYTLFALSLAPHLPARRVKWRLPLGHAVADGSYAVVIAHAREHRGRTDNDGYLLGSFVMSFGAWVPSSIVGSFVADAVPDTIAYGLDFATPAIFIAFLVPYIRDWTAAAVMLAAGLGTLVGNDRLPTGTGPLVAIVAASLLGGSLRWGRETR
jgi:4-azaleucine resistance transporter AzlC